MKIFILLINIVLLTSCGKAIDMLKGDQFRTEDPKPLYTTTDEDLIYYSDIFYQNALDFGKRPKFIPMNFAELAYTKNNKENQYVNEGPRKSLKAHYIMADGTEIHNLEKYNGGSSVVGVCYSFWKNGRDIGIEILIDVTYWSQADEYSKRALIDHELGHCAYGKDHDTEMLAGIPTSVMYPTVVGHYGNFYKEYQEELHGNSKEYIYETINRY
jgi:hypothetical protein